MTKTDYIRQVDAMALPDSLQQRLGALAGTRAGLEPAPTKGTEETRRVRDAAPYGGRGTRAHNVRPYGRWATLAAALVLVVGLGVAAPALIQFFTTGGDITTPPPIPVATEVPAISDEELTELLAGAFPSPTENDTYSLLYSATQQGHTMGALLYRSGGHYVLGTIIVGVFDNATKAPVGDVQIHTGDLGEAVGILSREQVVYLLWTNCMGRGVDWTAGLYAFSHGELTAVTELPPYTVEGTLPEGALTMFDPEKNADFWTDHKAVINGTGLDIYSRNPEYHYIRNNEVEEWQLACSIQFQFSTGPDAAPAISDEELTELLVAAALDSSELNARSQWELLFSARQNGRTLGVARGISDMHAGGFSNLILGVFDDKTKAIVEENFHVWQGDNGQLYAWEETDGTIYLLPVNTTVTTGVETCSAGLYGFWGGSFLHIDQLPLDIINQEGVPSEAVEMFHWKAGPMGFWDDHKVVINGAGLDLYSRTPGWALTSRDKTQWTYLGRIPLPPPFSTGPDAAPAISDEELTELLAGAFPEPGENDSWELLERVDDFGYSPRPTTMGLLYYKGGYWVGGGEHYILCAYDNATKKPVGEAQILFCYGSHYLDYLTWSDSFGKHFLCAGTAFGQGTAETGHVGVFTFNGGAVTSGWDWGFSPDDPPIPELLKGAFDENANEDFWGFNHKALIAPGGLEVFRYNPEFSTDRRYDDDTVTHWIYEGYVPIMGDAPEQRVMETARRYLEDYYAPPNGEYGEQASTFYSIQRCELVPDYGVAFYGEDSSAYRVVLEDNEGGLERYFVFDGNMELLNVATSEWASPWDSYEGAKSQISIKGVPFGGHFNELDESIRATLVDTGETEDLSVTRPDMVTPWILKTYRSDSLEVVTATASEDALKQDLAEGDTITRERYDRVSGVEYVYQVRPLDGTYPTEGGLRIGDSVERAQKLFYNLPDPGEKYYNAGLDTLGITTENGVVTGLVAAASTRTMGEGIFY